MDFWADGNILPQAKFKQIQDAAQSNMYEFRSKHLRVYVLLLENGKIVILGGYKVTQKKDIVKFKAIVKEYIISINKK